MQRVSRKAPAKRTGRITRAHAAKDAASRDTGLHLVSSSLKGHFGDFWSTCRFDIAVADFEFNRRSRTLAYPRVAYAVYSSNCFFAPLLVDAHLSIRVLSFLAAIVPQLRHRFHGGIRKFGNLVLVLLHKPTNTDPYLAESAGPRDSQTNIFSSLNLLVILSYTTQCGIDSDTSIRVSPSFGCVT